MYQDERSIDVFVGRQFRILRRQTGTSQEEVAKVLNISYQQLQKYEHGHNRFPFSKLLVALQYLNHPVQHFIEKILEPLEGKQPTSCIVSIPTEDYVTLLGVAKGVERLARKVRNIVNVER